MLLSSIFFVLFLFAPIGGATGLSFAGVNGTQPIYDIPITLTNTQATATSANLQVKVSMNSSANAAYYNSTLLNVNWQDGSGNILNSWLESGETKTSSSSVYWVNLGSGIISGNVNLTIYQCIYPTSIVAMDGNHTGAEPNYTGTYGQYDNGANVFTGYWNFNSQGGFPSDWAVNSAGGSYTINNGIVVNGGSSWERVATSSGFNPQALVLDMNAYFNSLTGSASHQVGWNALYGPFYAVTDYTTAYNIEAYNGGHSTATFSASTSAYNIWSIWATTSNCFFTNNYGATITPSGNGFSAATSLPLAISCYGGSNHVYVQWMRTRIQPPNNVMPTITTGAITSTSYLLSTTNGQTSVNSPTTSTLYSYWDPQGAASLTGAYYLFSINSGSGYINQTWTPFNGQNWANESLPLSNYTAGTTIQWTVYASDSNGVEYSSSVQSFVVQANVTFYFTEGGELWLNGVSIANGTSATFNSLAPSTMAAIVSSGNCFSSFNWTYPADSSSTSNPLAFTPVGDCAFWAYMNQTWSGGYTQGWNTGNATGFNNGYSQGWNDGNASGYIHGFNVGNTTGFNDGCLSGWMNCASAVAGENRLYVAVAIVGQGDVNYTFISAGYHNGQPITVPGTTGNVSTPTVITSNNSQTTIQLTANPANGYAFDHWVFDDGATCDSASIYVSVNQCQLAVAVFTPTG